MTWWRIPLGRSWHIAKATGKRRPFGFWYEGECGRTNSDSRARLIRVTMARPESDLCERCVEVYATRQLAAMGVEP